MNLSSIHIDPAVLRTSFAAILVLVVLATRMTRGTARQTPEGLEFGMKPVIFWARLLFIPIYLVLIFYPVITHQHNMPLWVPFVLIALFAIILYQSPGNIVLTADAVVQHFWLRADKVIHYHEVMAIQSLQSDRLTRVMGDNRTNITHTSGHSDSPRFRTELEHRTNKTITA